MQGRGVPRPYIFYKMNIKNRPWRVCEKKQQGYVSLLLLFLVWEKIYRRVLLLRELLEELRDEELDEALLPDDELRLLLLLAER